MYKRAIGLGLLSAAAALTPVQAAQPVGNDDYPLEALSKGEQGIVLTDLTIGADGQVKDCKVLVSPKSEILPTATCKSFLTKAHFTPAHDDDGNAKEAHVRAKMTWVIPGCRPPKQKDHELDDPVHVVVTVTSLKHC